MSKIHESGESRAVAMRKRMRRMAWPSFLGSVRSTEPVSDWWGFDRGTPVDRFYIERFLDEHRRLIRGSVLEVKDNAYTRRYGAAVERSDVVDIDAANPEATIVADLAAADSIPSGTFDCFILTQTLQLIFDTRAVIRHAHRILKPGGALLVTAPSVSRIVQGSGLETDFWRFTIASGRALFEPVFGPDGTRVRSYGNVRACTAFLQGLALEELTRGELEHHDDYFPLVVAVCAVKSHGTSN